MLGAMQPLTFIADMAPLGALGKAIAGWTAPLLIGGGAHAERGAQDHRRGHRAARRSDATAQVWTLMRRKSPAELAAMRDACAHPEGGHGGHPRIGAACGHRHANVVLAGERAAIDARRAGRAHAVQPRRRAHAAAVRDAATTGASIRCRSMSRCARFNYWAEGFACISNEPQPADRARRAAAATTRWRRSSPACRWRSLPKILAVGAPYRAHPVTQGALAMPDRPCARRRRSRTRRVRGRRGLFGAGRPHRRRRRPRHRVGDDRGPRRRQRRALAIRHCLSAQTTT